MAGSPDKVIEVIEANKGKPAAEVYNALVDGGCLPGYEKKEVGSPASAAKPGEKPGSPFGGPEANMGDKSSEDLLGMEMPEARNSAAMFAVGAFKKKKSPEKDAKEASYAEDDEEKKGKAAK
jgi:hypothetical protein